MNDPAGGSASCPHCGDVHGAELGRCPKTGRPLSGRPANSIEPILDGAYRLGRTLGRGGMGEVFEAEHLPTGNRLAIKRMHPELARNPKSVERFLHQAKALSELDHDNVVRVQEFGQDNLGAPYLVMERLEGLTLRAQLETCGRLEKEQAASLVSQLLVALSELHEQSIVHLDLKPRNIFLVARGNQHIVKVLDFGMAQFSTTPPSDKTPGGTPHYMSPEQIRGQTKIDGRSDLYAAGVILFECLTGQRPFDVENRYALTRRILEGDASELLDLRGDLPPSLVRIVERAMHPDPEHRFFSAQEMLDRLLPFALLNNGETPALVPTTLPPAVLSAQQSVPVGRSLPTARRARPQKAPAEFRASSKDWDPSRHPPLWESAARSRSQSTQLGGAFLIAALNVLEEAMAPAQIAQMRSDLDLGVAILAVGWFPIEIFEGLFTRAETLGHDGNALAKRAGAQMAERPATRRMVQRADSVRGCLHLAERFFVQAHDTGRAAASDLDPGVRIEVSGLGREPYVHSVALSGYFRRVAELAGGMDARAQLSAARGLGDAQTLIDVFWSS